MKNLLIAIIFVGTTISGFSQSRNTKTSLEVDGVCLMCKDRIEKACIAAKGVKYADWDVYTHNLKLIYNAKKTDLETIKKTIASVGHDVEGLKAGDEAYASLDKCCKYRDPKVIEDHETGEIE